MTAVRRPNILVVDDAPLFREVEALYLGRLGEVRVAASAAEARAQLASQPADVVVLDLHLADQPGDVLCRELSVEALHQHTRWLLVTRDDADDHARAVRAGATDVLVKPLERAELVTAVARLLRPGRGQPRATLREPAHVWATDRISTGTVQNVSRGGLFVASGWLPREGAELRVEFALPGAAAPISTSGQVRWRRVRADQGAPGFGLRFLALGGDALRALASYVDEHAPDAFDAVAP